MILSVRRNSVYVKFILPAKKMSLTKLKRKETEGKQKHLPKLKTILANPIKKRWPILDEMEMDCLKIILKSAIAESDIHPRRFATEKGICLGLESSLRNINNQTSSCVFISLSIKPNYIIGLIAKNAETKDETQPVYAQPKLENFLEDIFGVQALCMVFPKNLLVISDKLNKWVEERKNPTKIEKFDEVKKQNCKKKLTKVKTETPGGITMKAEKPNLENVPKDMTGDFISFANDVHETVSSKFEDDNAIDALTEIINKIPTSTASNPKSSNKIEAMELDNDKELLTASEINRIEEDDFSDNFLTEYKPLTVHKIKANPNKKTKRKRRKNKKNSGK